MKKNTYLLYLFVSTFLFSPALHSQVTGSKPQKTDVTSINDVPVSNDAELNKERHFSGLFGVGIIRGGAQGEFKREMNNQIRGIDLYGGYSPPNLSFAIGADVAYMNYGAENTWQRLGTSGTNPLYVSVNTNYNVVTAHSFIRYQPNFGFINPYIEGLIGVNYFYTVSHTEQEEGVGGPSFADNTNLSDLGLSYGIGGGVSFKLFSIRPDMENGVVVGYKDAIYLDARIRYLLGSTQKYLKEGSIVIVKDANGNDVTAYIPSESKTDMISIQVGVSFRF